MQDIYLCKDWHCLDVKRRFESTDEDFPKCECRESSDEEDDLNIEAMVGDMDPDDLMENVEDLSSDYD